MSITDRPMVFLCKFGQNPPIGSRDKISEKAHFHSLYGTMTLKIRALLVRHKNTGP